MIVVVDTNVLISGFLTPHGSPGRVVDLLLRRSIQAAFDDRILGEYLEVSLREKFAFDRDAIASVLDFIEGEGLKVLAPALDARLPDPDDLPFLEVAVEAKAAALITGNARHFRDAERFGVAVASSAQFLGMVH